jgi:hypothetical protein
MKIKIKKENDLVYLNSSCFFIKFEMTVLNKFYAGNEKLYHNYLKYLTEQVVYGIINRTAILVGVVCIMLFGLNKLLVS